MAQQTGRNAGLFLVCFLSKQRTHLSPHPARAQWITRIHGVADRTPSSSCRGRICKNFASRGKAKRHEDPSWPQRKTKKQLVTQLGLIAFRLLCHLWVPGGELCSAPSFTLILSGVSVRLCPKHEGLQKGKVLSPTSCSAVIYLCLPDLQHFLCSLQYSIGLIRPL